MKKYKMIIFDLDGTLLDTSAGIINCYNYVADLYNKKILGKDSFTGVIGSPLRDVLVNKYHVDELDLENAIEIYRNKYSLEGIHKFTIYDGIPELLASLKSSGIFLAVATLKLEKFAKEMLALNNLGNFFDGIYGSDEKDTLTKSMLVKTAIEHACIDPKEVVLIGDSRFDAEGAAEVGIDFIGVTYGLGFQSIDEIKNGYYTNYTSSVFDLEKLLL